MSTTARRSHSWFQNGCRYYAIRRITGVEVVPTGRIAEVQLSQTTLHGSPAQLRHVAGQLLRAAALAESGS